MDNATAFLHPLINSFTTSAMWFGLCLVLFILLARLFPGKPTQPLFRRDMIADAVYWFCGPVIYGPAAGFLTSLLLIHLYNEDRVDLLVHEGLPPLSDLPLWLQAILILLATDFLQYWAHRLFHHAPLWKYHAVHHSSPHVDWLSAARFHPVNIILYSTLAYSIVAALGFSPGAFVVLAPFNAIYSPLVHANLNWTYGPFRYVLASPVFHRWHHTSPKEGGNKNFAPTFPFLDLMFGTFYMPKGVQPTNFGTPYDPVPDDFFGQIAYPFRKRGK